MGKMKKAKKSSTTSPIYSVPGDPIGPKVALADEIESLKLAKSKDRNKFNKTQSDEKFINEKLSAKILSQAREQNKQLQKEVCNDSDNDDNNENNAKKYSGLTKTSFLSNRNNKSDNESSDSNSESDEDDINENNYYDQEIMINEEDQKAYDKFTLNEPKQSRTIADIIMEKLTQKKTEIETINIDDNESRVMEVHLDDRIVNMYKQIGEVLSKYRSGKLPKAFKILPTLTNWEHILYITEPDKWSAASIYQATRIFASNLNAKMAQRFYYLVLLPRIRDDIAEYKRLNFHLYMALKKALYKPAAFFKGILLPLCDSRTCTLREAIIISSVLAKNSIPMLHSAAAILKLAEMEYTGGNSIFIRILLDKKYALPYRVIDALIHHFTLFKSDTRELPVLWHQALLTFCQRYKEDISTEQKESLME